MSGSMATILSTASAAAAASTTTPTPLTTVPTTTTIPSSCNTTATATTNSCSTTVVTSPSNLTSIGQQRVRRLVLGVCAMDKKTRSKPMTQILDRLRAYGEFDIIIFGDRLILDETIPVESWPQCHCLISFTSKGFPLTRVIEYVRLRKPFCVNDIPSQVVLQNRYDIYRILEKHQIPTPKHLYVDRSQTVTDGTAKPLPEVLEFDDYIEIDGVRMEKPLVEKPYDGDDHNIYIYYGKKHGGGSRRLFRKVGNRSSRFYPKVNSLRKNGSYIYESLLLQGKDLKVYTIGPGYAHGEMRKSPVVDGVVARDPDQKELRLLTKLTEEEREMARLICVAFKQNICGFDIIRTQGKSYVIDVNGWSFVKGNMRYYDKCARIMRKMCLNCMKGREALKLERPLQYISIPTTHATGTTPTAGATSPTPIEASSELDSSVVNTTSGKGGRNISSTPQPTSRVISKEKESKEKSESTVPAGIPRLVLPDKNDSVNDLSNIIPLDSTTTASSTVAQSAVITPMHPALSFGGFQLDSSVPYSSSLSSYLTSPSNPQAIGVTMASNIISDSDNNDILLGLVAMFRHADRTPKQKVKLKTKSQTLMQLFDEQRKEWLKNNQQNEQNSSASNKNSDAANSAPNSTRKASIKKNKSFESSAKEEESTAEKEKNTTGGSDKESKSGSTNATTSLANADASISPSTDKKEKDASKKDKEFQYKDLKWKKKAELVRIREAIKILLVKEQLREKRKKKALAAQAAAQTAAAAKEGTEVGEGEHTDGARTTSPSTLAPPAAAPNSNDWSDDESEMMSTLRTTYKLYGGNEDVTTGLHDDLLEAAISAEQARERERDALKDPDYMPKLYQISSVLEKSYGGVKVQLKPKKVENGRVVQALLIVKWGGEMTHAGVGQARQYAAAFWDDVIPPPYSASAGTASNSTALGPGGNKPTQTGPHKGVIDITSASHPGTTSVLASMANTNATNSDSPIIGSTPAPSSLALPSSILQTFQPAESVPTFVSPSPSPTPSIKNRDLDKDRAIQAAMLQDSHEHESLIGEQQILSPILTQPETTQGNDVHADSGVPLSSAMSPTGSPRHAQSSSWVPHLQEPSSTPPLANEKTTCSSATPTVDSSLESHSSDPSMSPQPIAHGTSLVGCEFAYDHNSSLTQSDRAKLKTQLQQARQAQATTFQRTPSITTIPEHSPASSLPITPKRGNQNNQPTTTSGNTSQTGSTTTTPPHISASTDMAIESLKDQFIIPDILPIANPPQLQPQSSGGSSRKPSKIVTSSVLSLTNHQQAQSQQSSGGSNKDKDRDNSGGSERGLISSSSVKDLTMSGGGVDSSLTPLTSPVTPSTAGTNTTITSQSTATTSSSHRDDAAERLASFRRKRLAFFQGLQMYASDEARVVASAEAFYTSTFEHAHGLSGLSGLGGLSGMNSAGLDKDERKKISAIRDWIEATRKTHINHDKHVQAYLDDTSMCQEAMARAKEGVKYIMMAETGLTPAQVTRHMLAQEQIARATSEEERKEIVHAEEQSLRLARAEAEAREKEEQVAAAAERTQRMEEEVMEKLMDRLAELEEDGMNLERKVTEMREHVKRKVAAAAANNTTSPAEQEFDFALTDTHASPEVVAELEDLLRKIYAKLLETSSTKKKANKHKATSIDVLTAAAEKLSLEQSSSGSSDKNSSKAHRLISPPTPPAVSPPPSPSSFGPTAMTEWGVRCLRWIGKPRNTLVKLYDLLLQLQVQIHSKCEWAERHPEEAAPTTTQTSNESSTVPTATSHSRKGSDGSTSNAKEATVKELKEAKSKEGISGSSAKESSLDQQRNSVSKSSASTGSATLQPTKTIPATQSASTEFDYVYEWEDGDEEIVGKGCKIKRPPTTRFGLGHLLCHKETLYLMRARWDSLIASFYHAKTDTFDPTKLPDVYDCIKYDVLHNLEFLTDVRPLYSAIKRIADFVVPNEYGILRKDKWSIGVGIARPLLHRMISQLESALSPKCASRVTLYFSSESHIHALRNVLLLSGIACNRTVATSLDAIELNYLSHAVFRLYEDVSKPIDDPLRYYVNVQFSPGAALDPFIFAEEEHTLPVSRPVPVHGRIPFHVFKSIFSITSSTESQPPRGYVQPWITQQGERV